MAIHDDAVAQAGTAGRIQSVDILRGFALLGMIVVHFHDHSTEPGGIDDVIRTLVWRLVESKSHGTFALLFGVGFAIQLRRAEARGAPFVGLYLRRLMVLALFGFAAHAFFGFNVLLGYAAWGVPLLAIRNWSTRALLVVALLSAVSLPLYHFATFWLQALTSGTDAAIANIEARRALAATVYAAVDAAEAQSSYLVLLAARLKHMAWFYRQPFFVLPWVTLMFFTLGLLLVRHRVFEEVQAHRRLLAGMAAFGVISWIADNWLLPMSFGLLRDQWLTFTYVSLALLAMAHWPVLVTRLRVFANAGRMALTNYLIQIAAIDLLFSGYALGLGKIRPLAGPALAGALFAAEAAFSTLWMKHYRLGPAEWVWRSLTYLERQPMRRVAAPVESATQV